jgi:hypothetical protein
VERFRSYLSSKQIIPEKKLDYYLSWVIQFYDFCDKPLYNEVSADEIDAFLKHLARSREEWQVNQASEAIQLFIYFNRREYQGQAKADLDSNTQWKAVAQDMVRMLRLKHRSLSTEKSYIGWLRSF